jgi:hypothetical protein
VKVLLLLLALALVMYLLTGCFGGGGHTFSDLQAAGRTDVGGMSLPTPVPHLPIMWID